MHARCRYIELIPEFKRQFEAPACVQSEMVPLRYNNIILSLSICVSAILLCIIMQCAIGRASEVHPGSDSLRYYYNITCDPHLEEDCQSESLETIAVKLEEKPRDIAVQIDIKTSQLQLNTTVQISNISNLTIIGHGENTNILCSDEFENSTLLVLVLC